MFSLLRFFDEIFDINFWHNNWRSVFDIVKRLRSWSSFWPSFYHRGFYYMTSCFWWKLGQKLDRGHQLKSELNILLALVAAVWSRTFFQNTSVILFMLTINKIVPVSIALHILKWHWPFLISRFDQGVFQWMNKKRFLYCSWLVRVIEISSYILFICT